MNCWPRLPCRRSRLLSPQLQKARHPVSFSASPSAVRFPPAVATFARDSSLLFPHSINGRRGGLSIQRQLNRPWTLTLLYGACLPACLCLDKPFSTATFEICPRHPPSNATRIRGSCCSLSQGCGQDAVKKKSFELTRSGWVLYGGKILSTAESIYAPSKLPVASPSHSSNLYLLGSSL